MTRPSLHYLLGPQSVSPVAGRSCFGAIMFLRPLVIVVLLGSALFVRAQAVDLPAIDREVQSALKLWRTPGMAVVIVGPGKVYLLKGYGRHSLGLPAQVTADTLFPLASCTKAFTSTALAMLVDGGKLGWDDPVRKHLPDFHLADPDADALVTVRDLLCHRTGVGGHDFLWYRAPWGQDE